MKYPATPYSGFNTAPTTIATNDNDVTIATDESTSRAATPSVPTNSMKEQSNPIATDNDDVDNNAFVGDNSTGGNDMINDQKGKNNFDGGGGGDDKEITIYIEQI